MGGVGAVHREMCLFSHKKKDFNNNIMLYDIIDLLSHDTK